MIGQGVTAHVHNGIVLCPKCYDKRTFKAIASVVAEMPEYFGLQVAAFLLTAVGVIQTVVGSAWLLLAILGVVSQAEDATTRIFPAFICFVVGVLLWGSGEGLSAVRDMARNSFAYRKLQ